MNFVLILFISVILLVWGQSVAEEACRPLEPHTLPDSNQGIRIGRSHTQDNVSVVIRNIRLPYGVGIYVRSSPLDATKKKLITNTFLDSGTAGVVRPRRRGSRLNALLYRKADPSMFENARYYRMELLDGKCRTYNLYIDYPMDVFMDSCKQTFGEDEQGSGIEMKLTLYWGFVRPIKSKTSYWEKEEHETSITLFSGSHPKTRARGVKQP
eukprot:CAMPEP_0117428626 /NCGR_PEP_ID=MMETSP0758-20121206/8291_1 /TAXON_ID=63605 /ORGANISM="Percolomonas cosmopolitus, Strain AE-1 (ATCC 50343)" /LENGTH=210 /DNA_ID=CAMNT_0005215085 /DNA_START=1 /DNA_END=629 /DNA_ORIENTATION=+